MPINPIICLDFETGGLKPTKNPALEIAYEAFELDSYKTILEFESFIEPYNDLDIDQKALDVNGITYAQIATGRPVKEIVKKLEEDFKNAHTNGNFRMKPILLGHNFGFDVGFLCYIFNLCKADLGKYFDCNDDAFGNSIPKFIDTQVLAKQKWANDPKMTKYNLSACCQKAGIEIIDAHRAKNDVKATKELFFYLTNGLRSGSTIATQENTKHTRLRNYFKF